MGEELEMIELPEETWEPITGFEGIYEISNHGRTWRHRRFVVQIHRSYWQEAGLLMPYPGNTHGHRKVTLYDAAGRRHRFWVHRLVAEHHIPNPEGLPYVLHGIEGPAINHVGNLRWGDHSENELDKKRHALARQRERELR